ncbi:Cyclohexadienyl dehydratase [bioreactor metagenome]|uniref:Cyclohexadienyl dehydratase n=1 Tax=bioreactor metagenome TaxID=1076179 RepID=A0A644YGF4_9ZZZZ
MRIVQRRRFLNTALITAIAATCALASLSASAGQRLDQIMQTKTLRVGTPGDYRPFAIKTDAGYSGHDVDVIEAMAKEMGVKIEWVATTWPNLMPDLKANKYDIAVGGITRNVARISQANMLPGYAPFGKVALVRATDQQKFTTPQSLNQSGVRVIKSPGGTNEAYVLQNLTSATVSTHDKNAEIPALIAEGKGDVMITETYEALHYARTDPRLFAAFLDKPLTPVNTLGFMFPADDADYARVLRFTWELIDNRGGLKAAAQKWLK